MHIKYVFQISFAAVLVNVEEVPVRRELGYIMRADEKGETGGGEGDGARERFFFTFRLRTTEELLCNQ